MHELERSAYKLEIASDEKISHYACDRNQPTEALNQQQQTQLLMTALRSLPLKDRSALAFAYFQDLDLASIARIEGCTANAIKVRLHRAKQQLRQLLEEQYEQ